MRPLLLALLLCSILPVGLVEPTYAQDKEFLLVPVVIGRDVNAVDVIIRNAIAQALKNALVEIGLPNQTAESIANDWNQRWTQAEGIKAINPLTNNGYTIRDDRRTDEEGTFRLWLGQSDGSSNYAFCRGEFEETSEGGKTSWILFVDGHEGIGVQYWIRKEAILKGSPRSWLYGIMTLKLARKDIVNQARADGICDGRFVSGTILKRMRM